MHFLFYLFTKLTAVPFEMIFFRRKNYYEDRNQKNRFIRGGALYVSNHRSFWDYICYFFVVYFHKLRPIVSELIYQKNPVLRFLLKMNGAIVVGKNNLDVNYIDTCVSLLRQGKKIIIFPEGHFNKEDVVREFSPSFAKMAIEADVPVVPLYIDGVYSFLHRTHVMIGKKMMARDYVSSSSNEDVRIFAKAVEEKVRQLKIITDKRKKNPLFNPARFGMDFGRLFAMTHFDPFMRVHKHNPEGKKHYHKMDGPLLIVANHMEFSDPIVVMLGFFRRRVFILIAKEVFGEEGKHRIRKKLLKDIGGIKIDREKFDIEAINQCCDVLNSGYALLAFPEGHLNHDKKITSFKEGVMLVAAKTQTPILPLYICGAKHIYNTRHIYLGEVIPPPKMNMSEIAKRSKEVQTRIEELKQKAIQEGKESD